MVDLKPPLPGALLGFVVRCRTGVAGVREIITLACTECKRRNYTTMKNKRNDPERVEFKKYCKWCERHTVHKETR